MKYHFSVTYETREEGAIGSFQHQTVHVSAVNEYHARAQARNRLQLAGFELRFPVACVNYGETPRTTQEA